MKSKTINFNDNVKFSDTTGSHKSGLWAKTEIIIGRGEVHNDGIHKSTLDEVDQVVSNTVPIGGVQYVMQNLFNIDAAVTIPTLYNDTPGGIGLPDSKTIDIEHDDAGIKFDTPEYDSNATDDNVGNWYKAVAPQFRPGHFVQLFGVGITGSGENDTTVYPVDYREKSIAMVKAETQTDKVIGTMLPFRYTTETLSNYDKAKYFGKKKVAISDGATTTAEKTAYYLKKFESTPEIHHVYASIDPDAETEVEASKIFDGETTEAAIDTYVEMVLKISYKDLKEWFIATGNANSARINTIALYSGKYVAPEEGAVNDFGDFQDVQLFSKLVFQPEYLALSKDLVIIYRVYGS